MIQRLKDQSKQVKNECRLRCHVVRPRHEQGSVTEQQKLRNPLFDAVLETAPPSLTSSFAAHLPFSQLHQDHPSVPPCPPRTSITSCHLQHPAPHIFFHAFTIYNRSLSYLRGVSSSTFDPWWQLIELWTTAGNLYSIASCHLQHHAPHIFAIYK